MRTRLSLALLVCSLGWSTPGVLAAQATKSRATPPVQKRASTARPVAPLGAELVIVVTDKSLDVPSQVDAGVVNVRLFNRSTGPQQVNILKVERLDRVASISEYLRSGDWNVPWINRMGGPESGLPGGVSSVAMVLEPGRYVVVPLPILSKPGGPLILRDVEELSVVQRPNGSAGAALPPAVATIKLYEWNFTIDGPLNAGRRVIRVDNTGQFEHQLQIIRLLPGRGIDQAVKWAENPSGPPPFEGVGGTTNLARGRSVNVTVDLIPGDYVLLCTTYNPLSKQLHSHHGMIKQIRVTR
ncbi:MAG: hypothetical protein ABI910_05830 [Gemmatimonadota bacterium]